MEIVVSLMAVGVAMGCLVALMLANIRDRRRRDENLS